MRPAALAALILCFSCQFGPSASERWAARGADRSEPGATVSDADIVAKRVGALRQRLDVDLPRPDATTGRRCPEETMAHTPGSRLPLRTRDVRVDRRQLLPLRLTQAFTSESIASARRDIDSSEMGAPGTMLGEATPSIEHWRYLAEFQIEVYRSPKLFRRKDAPRSEWAPGILTGALVVYDALEKRALCQTSVSVHVSGEGQPIRKRLRDAVRERLTGELERRARNELERALAELSNRLVLEPSAASAPAALLAEISR
jgi:hypothetical protein